MGKTKDFEFKKPKISVDECQQFLDELCPRAVKLSHIEIDSAPSKSCLNSGEQFDRNQGQNYDQVFCYSFKLKLDPIFVYVKVLGRFSSRVNYYERMNLRSLVATSVQVNLLKSHSANLKHLVFSDDLTHAFNYRKLVSDLKQLSSADDENFELFFIDIDNFKSINDHHGHMVGSSLLKQLADCFFQYAGQKVDIYRYGGDEFVFLTSGQQASIFRRSLPDFLQSLEKVKFKLEDGEFCSLSISIGHARYPEDADNWEHLIEIADKMMFECKKNKNADSFDVITKIINLS